jgi:hypothetical protein
VDIPNDFKELLVLLNAHKVEYLVCGAFALAHHGAPRFTGDLDVFIKPDRDNAERIVACLKDFGFESLGLQTADFIVPEQVIQLGVAPVRIDFLCTLTGITWQEAFEGKEQGVLGGIPVFYVGKETIRKNKKSTGTPQRPCRS